MNEIEKEIAKATTKALEVAEKVGVFFTTVLGDTFKELGSSVHDWAKYFRYKNILKIQDKVNTLHEKRQTQGKSIPVKPSIGIPMLEAASLTDDEYLQHKWAALITNAMDPEQNNSIRKIYVDILSSLEPQDAVILDWMNEKRKSDKKAKITIALISSELSIEKKDVEIAVSNLNRQGLIGLRVPNTLDSIGISVSDHKAQIFLNSLSLAFLEACTA